MWPRVKEARGGGERSGTLGWKDPVFGLDLRHSDLDLQTSSRIKGVNHNQQELTMSSYLTCITHP